MSRLTATIAIITLTAALTSLSGSAAVAGEGKGAKSPRGTTAGESKSGKKVGNSNTRWLADPERGWVRTKNPDLRRHDRGTQEGKPSRVRQNKKGNARKF